MAFNLEKLQKKWARERSLQKLYQEFTPTQPTPLIKSCSCCGQNSDTYLSGQSSRLPDLTITICVDCVFETCLQNKAKNQFVDDLNLLKQIEQNKKIEQVEPTDNNVQIDESIE